MKIVFFGSGDIGLPALEFLLSNPAIEVSAVVTQPDRPAGRHMVMTPPPTKPLALAAGVPVFQPEKIGKISETLTAFDAELFVVVAYGQILPQRILDIPRLGCLNIHASLLPRHRGASPVQAAILAGDNHTGITIMWMDAGLDTGDILHSESFPLSSEETGGSLHEKLAALAPQALRQALDTIAAGHAPRTPQDNSRATHCRKISKADGLIRWTSPAGEIAAQIRAYSPWPKSFAVLPDGRRLIIHVARAEEDTHTATPGHILSADSTAIRVATGQGILAIEKLQLPGSRPLTSADFLHGHPLFNDENSYFINPHTEYRE